MPVFEDIREVDNSDIDDSSFDEYEISDSYIFNPIDDICDDNEQSQVDVKDDVYYDENTEKEQIHFVYPSEEVSLSSYDDLPEKFKDDIADNSVSYNIVYIDNGLSDEQFDHICKLVAECKTVSYNYVSSDQFQDAVTGFFALHVILIGLSFGYFVTQVLFRGV